MNGILGLYYAVRSTFNDADFLTGSGILFKQLLEMFNTFSKLFEKNTPATNDDKFNLFLSIFKLHWLRGYTNR